MTNDGPTRVLHLCAGNLYGGVERIVSECASDRHLCPRCRPASRSASTAGCRRRLTRPAPSARGSVRRVSVAHGRSSVPAGAWPRSSTDSTAVQLSSCATHPGSMRSLHRSSGSRPPDSCCGCTTGSRAAAGRSDGRPGRSPIWSSRTADSPARPRPRSIPGLRIPCFTRRFAPRARLATRAGACGTWGR